LRLEEVVVPRGSSFVGMQLKDTPIRRETRLLVVAVRETDRTFTYNPEPDHVIHEGTTLIVMGEADSVVKLRNLVVPQPPIAGARLLRARGSRSRSWICRSSLRCSGWGCRS